MTSAPRLSRVSIAILAATALAAPAIAGGPAYIKIDDIDGESTNAGHKGEIEVLSWSWGETNAGGAHAGGGGIGTGKANMSAEAAAAKKQMKVESLTIKQSAAASSGDEHEIEMDVHIGKAPPPPGSGGLAAAGEAEITLKNAAAKEKKRPGRVKYGDITLKRGAAESAGGVSVAAGDVDGDGTDAAAEAKSGSLQYLNRNRQKELAAPAPAGSLNLVVAAGHGLCTPGRSLGTLTLAAPDRRFVLEGVSVAGCAAAAQSGSSADVQPTETISLNYEGIR